MSKLACFFIAMCLVGCSGKRNPEYEAQVARERADMTTHKHNAILDRFNYIKDRYGVCYAYISSQTTHGYMVAAITDVPCDKVGLSE